MQGKASSSEATGNVTHQLRSSSKWSRTYAKININTVASLTAFHRRKATIQTAEGDEKIGKNTQHTSQLTHISARKTLLQGDFCCMFLCKRSYGDRNHVSRSEHIDTVKILFPHSSAILFNITATGLYSWEVTLFNINVWKVSYAPTPYVKQHYWCSKSQADVLVYSVCHSEESANCCIKDAMSQWQI